MLKRLVILCLILATAPSVVSASLCVPPTVEKSSPHHYLVSVANALVYAREGLTRLDDSKDDAYSLIVALKLQQSDYRCAESQVEPYASSADTIIGSSAEAVAGIFHHLAGIDDDLLAQAKSLIEPDARVSPATMAEKQGQDQVDLEQTWGLLVHAAILTTYSAIRVNPATGRMSRLALTIAQRDDVLEILRSGFGSDVSAGMKEGQHPLVAAAAVLYQVIGDPRRQLQGR